MGFLDEMIDSDQSKKHLDQGSEGWEQIRVGRFTSSEIFKLMGHGWREMNPEELKARPKKGKGSQTKRVPDYNMLSKEADTYIDDKVAEVLTGRAKFQSYAYPLVYGKEQEPIAVQLFEDRYQVVTEQIGFQTFTDHAGGSPDRIFGDEDGLEIKCPWDQSKQADYLRWSHINDVRDNCPDFYWQCVSLMLFTGRKRWHLCTYDGRYQNPNMQLTHFVFEATKLDEEFDLIVKAIENAVKYKLQCIQSLERISANTNPLLP